jgi:hypothetical protein
MRQLINLKRFLLIVLISNVLFFLSGCSSSLEIASKYPDNKVIIDGKDNEWENKTIYLKDDNILVGLQNDNAFLYLLISTSDRKKQMQILNSGLNIWFDPNGGNSKKLGMRFPLGRIESGQQFSNREDRTENPDNDIHENNMNQNRFSEIEIYEIETNSWNKNGLNEIKGLEVKMSKTNDRLVCEYKIPLKSQNADFYIPASGGKLGIGIETNQIDFNRLRNRMTAEREGGAGSSEGIPGDGGRRQHNGSRRQGQRGGERASSQSSKELKLWIIATLIQK